MAGAVELLKDLEFKDKVKLVLEKLRKVKEEKKNKAIVGSGSKEQHKQLLFSSVLYRLSASIHNWTGDEKESVDWGVCKKGKTVLQIFLETPDIFLGKR